MRMYWKALLSATALISTAAVAQGAAGIPTLSGGVGSSDRAMIESQQNSYALKLVYSGQGGAYLSGVQVTLADKGGNTVLSTVTDGPILLISPPAGNYSVTSSIGGHSKTQSVTAGSSLRTYQISFPISDDPELTSTDGTYLPKAASPVDRYNAAPVAPSHHPHGDHYHHDHGVYGHSHDQHVIGE